MNLVVEAQDKWSQNIIRLDSLDISDPEYGNLLVDICWQISDLSPDSAIFYGNRGLKLAEKLNNDSLKCRSLLGISGAISRQGKHSESIEISLQAMHLAESIGDTTSMYDAATNIGIDMYYQEDLERSLVYFKRSANYIKYYRQDTYKSKHQYATALMNVALAEAELGKTSNEIGTYYEVAKLFKDLGDSRNYGLVLFNLGKSYQVANQYDSAEKYYQKSLDIFHENQWSSAKSDVLTSWSKLLFAEKKYDRALKLTRQGLKIAQLSNNTLQERFAFKMMYQIFAEEAKFDSAYYYLSKYQELLNESRELEKQTYADELLAKYESEKKEQQIAQLEKDSIIKDLESARQKQLKTFSFIGAGLLLIAIALLYIRYRDKNKTNALLDAKNQELAKINATKDRLFSIISHDLKSPLSSFHMITKSLSDNWAVLEKEQLKEFIITLRDSSSDVKSMMDNLLKWALSQSQQLSYKPSKVNTVSVMEKVIKELCSVASLKKVAIKLEPKSMAEIIVDQEFLQIVLRNILSNALKFSAMESEIVVIVEENNNDQVISIQDYGVGMDQVQVEQLFAGEIVAHDIQNSSEKGTGLGLVLCKELMEKMGAQMEVTSEKGKGAIFKLIFQLAA